MSKYTSYWLGVAALALLLSASAETVTLARQSGAVGIATYGSIPVPAAPVISPESGTTFAGDSCTVTITCATYGATIYHTTNGVSPRLTDKFRYTGPFAITGTATIKAVAVLEGVKSDYATATITKRSLTLGEAASADASGSALNWTTGGDAQWTPVGDETTTSGLAAQSGAIGDASGEDFSTTWLQTEVSGAGTISFRWKVDCEWDDSGDMTWDHVVFCTNGVEAARMDGTSGWEELSFTFADAGTHTLRWTFMKDDYNEEVFADRAWVSGFTWTPSAPPPDPIPEISGDADVAGALAGSADVRLSGHIKTAAEYNAYRGWVNAKGLDHQTVKSSSRAWFSYAIGANGLVEKVFQNSDVAIDSLETESSGSFTFEVDIKDVLIGAGATAENLATVFDVQGAASLDKRSFSSDNVAVSLGVSANGKLSVSVTPKVTCGTFFVRVRMYADAEVPDEDEHEEVVNTYTVTYSPGVNGSGAQQTATKTHGVALTLKGATFTRSGYTQTGWSTSDGGSKAYDLGASYMANAAITLYPYWVANSGSDTLGGVQLWENGPYWADCNVGASQPEEYGYYFWWGDTVGYTNTGSGWISVKDGTSILFDNSGAAASTYGKDNSALLSAGYIDSTGNLASEHDAAHAHWGGVWRMPTYAEISALIDNCTTTWITTNGVSGRLVTGKGAFADRSIFLPAAGVGLDSYLYYPGSYGNSWSSTPYPDNSGLAWHLYFNSSSFYRSYDFRYFGRSVRPVRGFAE